MAVTEAIRLLKADEIECRVGAINEKGLSLLLFKDARVDQKILDETFTPFGWRRSHQSIDGSLYCTVEVWDKEKGQWIGKQDVGSGTSSYAEKEKGTASDSFKRACFNWGIGRELYTAPFIWIPAGKAAIEQKDGRFYTRERFAVASISYGDDRCITGLVIMNGNGVCVYAMQEKKQAGNTALPENQKDRIASQRAEESSSKSRVSGKTQLSQSATAQKATQKAEINQRQMAALNRELKRTGVPLEAVLGRYQLSDTGEMTATIYEKAMDCLRRSKDKAA